jgi:hypothetical protein
MAKSNKVILTDLTDYSLEYQVFHKLVGQGIKTTFGNRVNVLELAEELIFALDFVNGGEPDQPIALNTIPDLTGEDGVPAIDLIKYFKLEDYIIESVLDA